jgi:hypothetical protein
VLLLLVAMGFNMLMTHNTNTGSSEETTGSLSSAAPTIVGLAFDATGNGASL